MDIADVVTKKYKEMFNVAYVLVEQKNYRRAEQIYHEIVALSDLVQYQEAKRMAYICLTNLMVMEERLQDALACAVNALNFSVDEEQRQQAKVLINPISLALLKKGIELEQARNYSDAYLIYQLIYPYLSSKRQTVVKQEMTALASCGVGEK
ncbi:hypothetical protein [Pasteurella sp. PK-2025]|uniref:hypothetical protein n=1 Tax=unclassified Pasteurella TaxID=2621516 RepID=UPI003C75337C